MVVVQVIPPSHKVFRPQAKVVETNKVKRVKRERNPEREQLVRGIRC